MSINTTPIDPPIPVYEMFRFRAVLPGDEVEYGDGWSFDAHRVDRPSWLQPTSKVISYSEAKELPSPSQGEVWLIKGLEKPALMVGNRDGLPPTLVMLSEWICLDEDHLFSALSHDRVMRDYMPSGR